MQTRVSPKLVPTQDNSKYELGHFVSLLYCRLINETNEQKCFTTSEMELDYHYKKLNVKVLLRVAERLKTYDLKKLGHF